MTTAARLLPDVAPIAPRRNPLRAVRAVSRRRAKPLYAVVAVASTIAIAAAQLTVSILTTQGSYELSSLSQQQRTLTWKKQILADDVAGLSSPQYLAANATALGMVIAESPNYLRLSDGAVLGTAGGGAPGSSIDALGRGAVGNSLITATPLVTDPAATIAGVPIPPAVPGEQTTDPATPPALSEGLPTPSTH